MTERQTDEWRQREYRSAAALGYWSERLLVAAPLSLFAVPGIMLARHRIDVQLFAGFVPFVLLLIVSLVLGARGGRIRRHVDADLDRVPWAEMEKLAYWLYNRLCVCTDAPDCYERMARVWLARGQIEQPAGRRSLTDAEIAQLPKPYAQPRWTTDQI